MLIQDLQVQLENAQKKNRQHHYAEAELLARQVLLSCDQLLEQGNLPNHHSLYAFGNRVIAESLSLRGSFKDALLFAQKSESFSETIGSNEEKIQCGILFGVIYNHLGDYPAAIRHLVHAEDIAEQIKSSELLTLVRITIGSLLLTTDVSTAIEILTESIEVAQRIGSNALLGNATRNLGFGYYILGNYDMAQDLYERSIIIFKSENDIFGLSKSLDNIGTLLLTRGNFVDALQYLQEALMLQKQVGAKHAIGMLLCNIASVYRQMGVYQKSLEYNFESLKLLEECGLKKGIGIALGNIAIAYRFLQDFNNAKQYFLQSMEVFSSIGIIGGGTMNIGNLGTMLFENGYLVEAKQYLEQVIYLCQNENMQVQEAQFSLSLARLLSASEDFDKAKNLLIRSYNFFCNNQRLDEEAPTLYYLGDLYANPAFAEYNVELAEQYYLQSINKFTELGNKHGLYDAHQHISQFYKQNNRWEEYAANIEKSMELYKEVQNDEVKKQADRFGWERKIAEMEKEKEIEKVRTEAEKKLLEQQVASQKREVETTIHELVNKNSLLHEVRKDVQALSKYTIREGQDVVERLIDRLERNIVPLESKSDLEKQWTEVHAPFMELMKQRYPTLTTMELKICALLKMKLTSSNICSILFLSKRTVEFHRLNIRKKMGLSKSDDIHVILNSLT